MSNNPIKDKKYLDGEQLFTVYWKDMGTARSTLRLQKWCLANSIVNPKTQNVPTRMGLWKVMWRWATENQEKSYPIWRNAVSSEIEDENLPEIGFQNDWKSLILKNAKTAFQNSIHLKNYYKSMEKK